MLRILLLLAYLPSNADISFFWMDVGLSFMTLLQFFMNSISFCA